jgi:uncharacterized membrane protein
MSVLGDRLDGIESRLVRIERALAQRAGAEPVTPQPPPPSAAEPGPAPEPLAAPRAPDRVPPPAGPRPGAAPRAQDATAGATQWMAVAASAAFLLGAVYFVKLVYDTGWLTPERQAGIAFLSGAALIGAGLWFARTDRAYASYLPAVGVVVLYLAVYAGHFGYGLFGIEVALVGIGGTTLAALALGRVFASSAYSLLAVCGTYLIPLLNGAMRADLVGLVVYFSAWSLLFSFVSLQEGRRLTYLLALYFALLGFDGAFRLGGGAGWALAASYQLVQFAVFAATAAAFSVRHAQPMASEEAIAHGVALFYFYAIEYLLLAEHAPRLAPVLALGSVAAVLALYAAAQRRLGAQLRGQAGAVLVSTYAAVVTGHVVFFELLDARWSPWAALLLPAAVALLRARLRVSGAALLPPALVSGALFAFGYARLIVGGPARGGVPLPEPLLFLYAGVLYAAYAWLRRLRGSHDAAPIALYAAHVAFLAATIRVFDSGLALSVAWAATAVIVLIYAVKREDVAVGQSSLVIFSASALKVLLYDLSGRAPVVRVLTLMLLAASLYAGGWLYQQVVRDQRRHHPDPLVNQQLNLIRRLAERGFSDASIVGELLRRGIPCLADEGRGEWSEARIRDIRREYGWLAP